MRRRQLVVVLLASAVWLLPQAERSRAALATAASCTFEAHETGSPGLSLATPTRGDNVTTPPGVIHCTGVVAGRALAPAPGRIFYTATYGTGALTKERGDTCLLGSGDGRMHLSLPTLSGEPVALEGPFDWEAVGPTAVLRGRVGDVRVEMALQFRPDPDHPEEDCVRQPLRHFITTGQGTLGGPVPGG